MTISSLGVGSGLALDDLVQQLISAERKPKEDRLNAREEAVEAEISALGSIKSKLSEFKDAVDDLRTDSDINGREPTITNPSEDDDVLSPMPNGVLEPELINVLFIVAESIAMLARFSFEPGLLSAR